MLVTRSNILVWTLNFMYGEIISDIFLRNKKDGNNNNNKDFILRG